jgi:hypothetical protein
MRGATGGYKAGERRQRQKLTPFFSLENFAVA